MENQNELELIEGILTGQKSYYEILIKKYNQKLYRVARGILNDEDQIEDAMQEAYIKAYQQLEKFEQRSAFSTWLTRILINECLMQKRKMKKIIRTDINQEAGNRSDNSNPENTVINNELRIIIENAIDKLPEKYKTVFIMREIENMSINETGEILVITSTNVKARLSRAKEMLRENISRELPANQLFTFNLIRCDRIVSEVMTRI